MNCLGTGRHNEHSFSLAVLSRYVPSGRRHRGRVFRPRSLPNSSKRRHMSSTPAKDIKEPSLLATGVVSSAQDMEMAAM